MTLRETLKLLDAGILDAAEEHGMAESALREILVETRPLEREKLINLWSTDSTEKDYDLEGKDEKPIYDLIRESRVPYAP